MITRQQQKLLKVAARQLGWTDAQYRSALTQIAGVTTSSDLDRDGFDAMMGFAAHCGFRPLDAKGPDYGHRPGMASFAQMELIRVIWAEYTRFRAGEDELNKWLERSFKVSSLRFLTAPMGQKVITALKAMKARAVAARQPKPPEAA